MPQTNTKNYWYTDTVQEDDPDNAVFGKNTIGVVDDRAGGIVAYIHRNSATPKLLALLNNTL